MKIDIPDDLWALWCWWCGARSKDSYGALVHELLWDMSGPDEGLTYNIDEDIFSIYSEFNYYDDEYPRKVKMPRMFSPVLKKYFKEEFMWNETEEEKEDVRIYNGDSIKYETKSINQLLKIIVNDVKIKEKKDRARKNKTEEEEREERTKKAEARKRVSEARKKHLNL